MRGSPVRVRLSAHFTLESEYKRSDSMFFSIKMDTADLAQLVEHWLPKPRVAGSSPVIRSPKSPKKGVKIEKLTRK